MSDLLFRPVGELAALVRSGELGARELVQASIDRIDALNPELNAFVDVFADEALAAAGSVTPGDERPFAGVPIAIKNNVPLAGHRLTYGSD
ncbi:MAG: amidase, partial [Solirubrobacteraceae bacterium]|nr:amidase [Solirubrobacteraceae bacterium]